ERTDRAVNNLGIPRLDCLVIDAETLRHTWTEALDEDIRRLAQGQQRFPAGLGLEVHNNAFLAAVEVAEANSRIPVAFADMPPVSAAGRLDFDHLRPVIGHRQRQIRTRQERAQVEHPDSGQLHLNPLAQPADKSRWRRPAANTAGRPDVHRRSATDWRARAS